MSRIKEIIQFYEKVSKCMDNEAGNSSRAYGSHSTHTLMSYFPTVELHICTLLKGERKIDHPIHKNFKELTEESLQRAISLMQTHLKEYL